MTSVPYHQETERGVLASMLLDGDALTQGLATLSGGDFYHPHHREVFEAMGELRAARTPVDPLTLDMALSRRGTQEQVGGVGYLLRLADTLPTSAHIGAYIRDVQEDSRRRSALSILEAGTRQTQAYASLPDVLAKTCAGLGGIPLPGGAGQSTLSLLLASLAGLARDAREMGVGLPALDARFHLRPGEMTVLGARPGVGKSAFLLQTACKLALEKRTVLMVNLEMADKQIGDRLHALLSGVSLARTAGRTATLDDCCKMADALKIYERLPLCVESRQHTVGGIISAARQQHAGQRLALLVVDYLQLVQPGTVCGTREQEVAQVTRQLKLLALELDIPILLASQLSRAAETGGTRPRLSDLRESGAIEQDCDNVLFLHQPDEMSIAPELRAEYLRARRGGGRLVELHVAKQRQGESGLCFPLRFMPQRMCMWGIDPNKPDAKPRGEASA